MTPAKGYMEMKDSGIQWIGQIPTHWLLKKAKYCVSITNGSDPKSEGSVPVYGSGSESFKTCGEYKEGPAVLIGRKGATLHIPHYIEGRYWNVDTAFDVKPQEGFSLRYYYYLACVFDYNYYISQTTLPGMTQTNYNNMKLPCPSLDEQSAIASYLDAQCAKIDEIIAQAKASMEDYKQWKASIIYEAVTKGLDPNVEMKDSGIEWIGRMPVHWACQKVCRCFDVIGSGTTPKSLDDDYYSGKIPWLQSGDINGWYVEETSKHITTEALNTFSALKIYEAPFIAVAMYGASIANTSIVYLDACTNQACCVLSNPAEKIEFEYIFYAILASKEELLLSARGGTQPNISQEIIKQLKLPIPPQKEQQRIITYLHKKVTEIGRLVGEKQTLIDDLESYKKSLIYEVVTGKRRVY